MTKLCDFTRPTEDGETLACVLECGHLGYHEMVIRFEMRYKLNPQDDLVVEMAGGRSIPATPEERSQRLHQNKRSRVTYRANEQMAPDRQPSEPLPRCGLCHRDFEPGHSCASKPIRDDQLSKSKLR